MLPEPTEAALAHSGRVKAAVLDLIDASGGWIPFSRYMDFVLHAPGLGYYAAGSHKFGSAGDFVTAPELSPVFARTLARQVAELLPACDAEIIEIGAGTGVLARELISELARLGAPPARYRILELSGELRARQEAALLAESVSSETPVDWLERIPEHCRAVVLANEVLDSMPVHVARWSDECILERGVGRGPDGELAWSDRPSAGALLAAAQAIGACAPFVTEIGLAARAWVAEWSRHLDQGVMLLIDYGLTGREFYHPQRSSGTLRGHYRHQVVDDPFFLPGLVDITAHVDFSAIAAEAEGDGLEVLGFASQAQFLLNCGITDALEAFAPVGEIDYLREAARVKRLLSPAEMGELFKVIALGKGVDIPLLGFHAGDRRWAL